jgi:hypothetical protein
MEDELFETLYRLISAEAKRRPRRPRVQFSDAIILLVAAWAVLHDRPTCWACAQHHWPRRWHWLGLPSPQTMSDRLPTLGVQLLLEQVLRRVLAVTAVAGFCLCRRIDSKPLPVGHFSKDTDARRGHVGGGFTARGYKLFCCWGRAPAAVPEALVLGPMSLADPAGATALIEQLDRLHGGGHGAAGGYLLADATHDTNALHAYAAARGFQLLTPRKQPGTGLGHRAGGQEAGAVAAAEHRAARAAARPARGAGRDAGADALPPPRAGRARPGEHGQLRRRPATAAQLRASPASRSAVGGRQDDPQRPADLPESCNYAIDRKRCGVPGRGS